MPRKKKPKPQADQPPDPLAYFRYAGYFTPEMNRRAREAGCRTIKDKSDWFDRQYGGGSQREENHMHAPHRRWN